MSAISVRTVYMRPRQIGDDNLAVLNKKDP